MQETIGTPEGLLSQRQLQRSSSHSVEEEEIGPNVGGPFPAVGLLRLGHQSGSSLANREPNQHRFVPRFKTGGRLAEE